MKLLLLIFISCVVLACGSSTDPGVIGPSITTIDVTDLTLTTAKVNVNIESTDQGNISVRGICWGQQTSPELNDGYTTENGSGAGNFTAEMTGLLVKKYYVRAYAKVGDQVFYGNEITADITQLIPSISVTKKSTIDLNTVEMQTSITYTHSAPILEKGIVWGTGQNPTTTGGTKVIDAGAPLAFTSVIGSLSTMTTYHVRGYAITDLGTFYSNNQKIFILPPVVYGTVSDVDGNDYRTVTIGTKVWMADNLKVTKYNDGSPITAPTQGDFSTTTSGAYIPYGGAAGNVATFGYLYNSYAVNSGNVCPTGWHVPTLGDWSLLGNTLGGMAEAGGRMKETTGWNNPNLADNESGFSGRPGGSYCRVCSSNTGIFADMGTDGYWWCATTSTFFYLTNDQTNLRTLSTANVNDGLSIRCVQN